MKRIFIGFVILITLELCTAYSVKAIQSEQHFVQGYSRELPCTFSGKRFFIYGAQCGYGCDKFGRNCEKGICNPKDCNVKNGYTSISSTGKGLNYKVVCLNKSTNMSYSVYSDYNITSFFINNIYCGENCNINGQNCKRGLCNVNDCDIEHGFISLNLEYKRGYYGTTNRHWVCHNPNRNLSYFKNGQNKTFYYNQYVCGYNCDYQGKNCAYEENDDRIGICNPEDCPKGYAPETGYCKKIKGKKLLYKNKAGKFKNEALKSTINDFKMYSGFLNWLLIPWHHY